MVQNDRQLFRDIYDFKCKDRFCLYEQGLWPETYERWYGEGLSRSIPRHFLEGVENAIVAQTTDVYSQLNILYPCYLPIHYQAMPSQAKTLEEDTETAVIQDAWGTTLKIRKDGRSLPQYLDWPVKTMADWERYNAFFEGTVEVRLPKNWSGLTASIRTQTQGIVTLHCIGMFAFPREIMGVENLLMAFYDRPELIEKMLDDRLEFYFRLYEKPAAATQPDIAFIWEDMSYMQGPLLSPEFCRKYLLPRYKRLTAYFRDLGIHRIVVDSDGDVRKLIPIWREAGINGILPFEVKAGNNVEELVRQWPDMVFIGGIDKHQVALGETAIDAELNKRLPSILGRGGYIPSLDHWIPPDIGFSDFCCYRDRVLNFNR